MRKSFIKFLVTEGWVSKGSIKIFEPALVSDRDGDKYSGGRKLHHDIPNAFSHNGKNMFYSFDLTNRCNRGCPGCYVDRAKEIACNAVKDLPIKEYKGDLRKWEEWASKKEENKKILDDTKKQINANGGIRMFSAADYPNSSDPFYQQLMKEYGVVDNDYFKHNVTAFLDDAKQFGWHVKAITKEVTFLKDHIHHDALKGVDVSMNAQGFGLSHESVKALRHGNHDHKSLSDKDKEHLQSNLTKEDAKNIKKHAHKVIGRTVTHTPFDLTKILEHKGDDSHIGVITSGHDIPGNGIRYVPSQPKNPLSPKTIIMQVNFPEKLMHWLDGDTKYPSVQAVTNALNEYAAKYNKLRDAAKKGIEKGQLEVLAVNVKKEPETADNVEMEEATKETHDAVSTILKKDENGQWWQIQTSNGEEKHKNKANLVENFEQEFDHTNPPFTYKFTDQDTQHLLDKMKGIMCCAGEDEGKAAGGKCHHCKAKCGVGKTCENPATDEMTSDDVKESKFSKFTNMI